MLDRATVPASVAVETIDAFPVLSVPQPASPEPFSKSEEKMTTPPPSGHGDGPPASGVGVLLSGAIASELGESTAASVATSPASPASSFSVAGAMGAGR